MLEGYPCEESSIPFLAPCSGVVLEWGETAPAVELLNRHHAHIQDRSTLEQPTIQG